MTCEECIRIQTEELILKGKPKTGLRKEEERIKIAKALNNGFNIKNNKKLCNEKNQLKKSNKNLTLASRNLSYKLRCPFVCWCVCVCVYFCVFVCQPPVR